MDSNNIKLEADDTMRLRNIIQNSNVTELISFMNKTGVGVNTNIYSVKCDVKFTILHIMAVVFEAEGDYPNIVSYLLSQNAYYDIVDGKGCTPLHYAVVYFNIAATKLLLEAGADVNKAAQETEPTIEGHNQDCLYLDLCFLGFGIALKTSTLHLAVSRGYEHLFHRCFDCHDHDRQVISESEGGELYGEIIHVVLAHGADCNLLDWISLSPLHYAVDKNNIALVRDLLEAGANINMTSRREGTPLCCAVSEEMLKFLLSRDADPDMESRRGTALLQFIPKSFDLTVFLVANMCVNFDVKNCWAESPLLKAIHMNDEETVLFLMGAGYDPAPEVLALFNDRNSGIFTPEGERLMTLMEDVASNPRRLFDLCKFKIRSILRRNIKRTVNGLPLPQVLRDKIALKDLTLTLKRQRKERLKSNA